MQKEKLTPFAHPLYAICGGIKLFMRTRKKYFTCLWVLLAPLFVYSPVLAQSTVEAPPSEQTSPALEVNNASITDSAMGTESENDSVSRLVEFFAFVATYSKAMPSECADQKAEGRTYDCLHRFLSLLVLSLFFLLIGVIWGAGR